MDLTLEGIKKIIGGLYLENEVLRSELARLSPVNTAPGPAAQVPGQDQPNPTQPEPSGAGDRLLDDRKRAESGSDRDKSSGSDAA